MTKFFILFLSFSFLGSAALASGKTVLDLKRECDGSDSTSRPIKDIKLIACSSYLSGLHDMHAIYADEKMGVGVPFYCTPKNGLQNEQLIKIFLKWADANPEKLHYSDRLGFIAAMQQAFPCKDKE